LLIPDRSSRPEAVFRPLLALANRRRTVRPDGRGTRRKEGQAYVSRWKQAQVWRADARWRVGGADLDTFGLARIERTRL
jgi:hypothetical protein